MKNVFFLLVVMLSMAASAFGDDNAANFTLNCPQLEYPEIKENSLTQVSSTNFTIQYSCQPVECLYFATHGSFFPQNRKWAIYLKESANQIAESDVVKVSDPHVIAKNLLGDDAAIAKAQELVSQGVCKQAAEMPSSPFNP
jgi:hypothetical protein